MQHHIIEQPTKLSLPAHLQASTVSGEKGQEDTASDGDKQEKTSELPVEQCVPHNRVDALCGVMFVSALKAIYFYACANAYDLAYFSVAENSIQFILYSCSRFTCRCRLFVLLRTHHD